MQTIYLNPTISYKVNRLITVGAGVSYIYSDVILEKMFDTGLILYGVNEKLQQGSGDISMIANSDCDSHFSFDGDGHAYGLNFGTLIRPTERLQVGISYRGTADIDYDGTAKFTHPSVLVPVSDGNGGYLNVPVSQLVGEDMPSEQDSEASLSLPWRLNFGALYDISEIWDVSADINLTGWSAYDEVVVNFDTGKPYDTLIQKKDWENAFAYRLGTSYDINDSYVIRGGLMYDETPIPDNTLDGQLAGNDRIGMSIGFGYSMSVVKFDVSYLYLKFMDREKDNLVGYSDVDSDGVITANDRTILDNIMAAQGKGNYPVGNGDYESSSHFFSVSVSYSF